MGTFDCTTTYKHTGISKSFSHCSLGADTLTHGLYSLQEHGQVCSVLCLLLPLSFRFQYPMVPRRGLQAVRLEDAAEVLIEHKEAAAHPRVCTKGKKGGRDKSRGQRGIKSKWAVVHAGRGSERVQ